MVATSFVLHASWKVGAFRQPGGRGPEVVGPVGALWSGVCGGQPGEVESPPSIYVAPARMCYPWPMVDMLKSIVGRGVVTVMLASGALAMAACGEGKPAAGGPATPTPSTAAPQGKDLKLEHLSDVASDASFELRLAPGGTYRVGELGHVVLTLAPKGEYHVNQEYPMRLSMRGPSELTFPKTDIEKSDAAEYTESIAKFDVPLTPSVAGEHRVIADVDFAVCTEETCVPDQRKLALALTVE